MLRGLLQRRFVGLWLVAALVLIAAVIGASWDFEAARKLFREWRFSITRSLIQRECPDLLFDHPTWRCVQRLLSVLSIQKHKGRRFN